MVELLLTSHWILTGNLDVLLTNNIWALKLNASDVVKSSFHVLGKRLVFIRGELDLTQTGMWLASDSSHLAKQAARLAALEARRMTSKDCQNAGGFQ